MKKILSFFSIPPFARFTISPLLVCLLLTAYCLLSFGQPINKEQMFSILEQVKRQEIAAWAEGVMWARQHDNRQDEFDSRFTTIDIKILFSSNSIEATVQTLFESTTDGLTQIELDFDDRLTIDSMTGNMSSYNLAGETLTVDLDRAYNTGETFTIATTYHGNPRVIGGVKGFRFESHMGIPVVATLCTPYLSHYWWPCVDGPADKLDSIYLYITIPDTSYSGYPLYAASNGKLIDTTHTGDGWVTFEWHENYPIVPYYVSISISNYRIFSHYYNYGVDSMEVPYYVFPESYEQAQQTFAETVDMIIYFANLFGEYPFLNEKYSMAEIGFYGAIENQTKTIMGGVHSGWYMVVVHELAHMWFADMISPTSWHHVWVNEGFATYSEALWWGNKYGMDEYHSYMEGLEYFGSGTIYLTDISDPFRIFLEIVYKKGAWVLHMLRHVVGDSTFFNFLYAYATDPQFMYGNANTEDVQQVCENISGMDLSSFFDQWIYDEYYPHYEYSWSASAKPGEDRFQVQVRIRQKQKEFGWREIFEMPIDLRFQLSGGGDTTVVVQNNDTVQTYMFDFPEIPTALDFDPENWILCRAEEVGISEQVVERPSKLQLTISPNPFRVKTNISFSTGQSAKSVELKIYDATGRLVKEFSLLTTYSLLPTVIPWLGTDEQGKQLPPGIYFIRVGDQITNKVIKIK